MQFRTLDEIARQHLVVVFVDVSLHIVDLVLVAMSQQGFLALRHNLFIGFLNLYRIEFQHVARFQIHETVRSVLEVEILLQVTVKDVEQDDFVLIILKVFQGLKHRFVVAEAVKHVSENHHKAAPMRHLRYLVQALGRGSGLAFVLVVIVNQLLQFAVNQLIVHNR